MNSSSLISTYFARSFVSFSAFSPCVVPSNTSCASNATAIPSIFFFDVIFGLMLRKATFATEIFLTESRYWPAYWFCAPVARASLSIANVGRLSSFVVFVSALQRAKFPVLFFCVYSASAFSAVIDYLWPKSVNRIAAHITEFGTFIFSFFGERFIAFFTIHWFFNNQKYSVCKGKSELDPDYFAASVERVKRETAQTHFL